MIVIRKSGLNLIYIFMIFYSVYDILNSASAGNATDDRSQVYIFLVAVVGAMLWNTVLNGRVQKNYVIIAEVAFTVYYLADMFLIKGNSGWQVMVYSGLSVWWILTISVFSNSISKKLVNFISIQNFVRVMFLLFSAAVLYGAVNITANYSVDYARVGYIYHLLAMLPMVLLERNKKLRMLFLILATTLTIFSFKRGAIIILPCMLIVYYMSENAVGRKSNLLRLFGILAVLVIIWVAIDQFSGGYLSSRFTLDELSDGSGRSEIWKVALQNVSKRNAIQMLFGIQSGYESRLWTGIHNEWISYLNRNGIIGLILFGLVILSMAAQARKLYKRRSVLAPAYGALLIYVLGVCWVSGFYFVHSTFYIMLFIGCVQGLSQYSEDEIMRIIGD